MLHRTAHQEVKHFATPSPRSQQCAMMPPRSCLLVFLQAVGTLLQRKNVSPRRDAALVCTICKTPLLCICVPLHRLPASASPAQPADPNAGTSVVSVQEAYCGLPHRTCNASADVHSLSYSTQLCSPSALPSYAFTHPGVHDSDAHLMCCTVVLGCHAAAHAMGRHHMQHPCGVQVLEQAFAAFTQRYDAGMVVSDGHMMLQIIWCHSACWGPFPLGVSCACCCTLAHVPLLPQPCSICDRRTFCAGMPPSAHATTDQSAAWRCTLHMAGTFTPGQTWKALWKPAGGCESRHRYQLELCFHRSSRLRHGGARMRRRLPLLWPHWTFCKCQNAAAWQTLRTESVFHLNCTGICLDLGIHVLPSDSAQHISIKSRKGSQMIYL